MRFGCFEGRGGAQTDRQRHTVVSAHWVSRDVSVRPDSRGVSASQSGNLYASSEATTVINKKGWGNR